jgi:hypothetical protein
MATKVCEFVVYGDCPPAGVDAELRAWPGDAPEARGADGLAPVDRRDGADPRAAVQARAPEGPARGARLFYATRPPSVNAKTHYKRTMPDLDKLIRSVGDALKNIVWEDDARIVGWDTWKFYTDGASRLELEIWQLDKHELPARRAGNPFNQQSLFGD